MASVSALRVASLHTSFSERLVTDPEATALPGRRCPLTIQKNAYRIVIAHVFIEGLSIPEYSDALNEVLQLTAVEGSPWRTQKGVSLWNVLALRGIFSKERTKGLRRELSYWI